MGLGESNDVLGWLFVVDGGWVEVLEVDFCFAHESFSEIFANGSDSFFHFSKSVFVVRSNCTTHESLIGENGVGMAGGDLANSKDNISSTVYIP